jgi:hypothetical protein
MVSVIDPEEKEIKKMGLFSWNSPIFFCSSSLLLEANCLKCLSNQYSTCFLISHLLNLIKSLLNTMNKRFNIISSTKSDEEPLFYVKLHGKKQKRTFLISFCSLYNGLFCRHIDVNDKALFCNINYQF